MQATKHIVIVAGEESGDMHAATFVKQLRVKFPHFQISGVGGHHMENAGVSLVTNLTRYGVTGFSEVVRHIGVLRQAFLAIKNHLSMHKPDLLILVDCPGFNLRLAKFAKRVLGIRILYYISPQIWAWKAGRIKQIRECVDHMAVILPFEKKIYEKAGIPVSFVGHPLVDRITQSKKNQPGRQALGLPLHKRVIAMLPGSRFNEIERHMPVLRDTAKYLSSQLPNLHFVIPVADTIKPAIIEEYFNHLNVSYSLISGNTLATVEASDCVIVASGTASLECALLEKPMCIIYKASLLTYVAATQLIRVRYLGLCNLLQNQMIVPELLQHDCNVTELGLIAGQLLNDSDIITRMRTRLNHVKNTLSAQQADCSIEALIEKELFI